MAEEKIEFEGELTKRSMWLKEWRKRYFMLKSNKLYFSVHKNETHHGMIDLTDCLRIKSAEEMTNQPNCFEIVTPETTYYMYANSEKEKEEWIGAIGRAIVRYSSAFVNEA